MFTTYRNEFKRLKKLLGQGVVPEPSVSSDSKGLFYWSHGVINNFWPSEYRLKAQNIVDPSDVRSVDPKELIASLRRALSTTKTLWSLGKIYGYKGKSKVSHLHFWWMEELRGHSAKELKYHLIYLANRGRGQPPCPRDTNVQNIDGFLLDWEFRKWCLKRLKRDRTFGETLLIGVKKGLPSLTEYDKDKEVMGFMSDISRAPTVSEPELIREVHRTVLDVVGNSLTWEEIVSGTNPAEYFTFSQNASIESSIRQGGTRGWALRRWAELTGGSLTTFVISPSFTGFTRTPSGLVEEREPDYPWREVYLTLLEDWLRSEPARPSAFVCPIYEPLKIRPITVGSARLASLGRPVQRILLKRLQRFELFKLTGQEADEVSTSRVVTLPIEEENPVFEIKSGDFKASTNNINMDLSTACLDAAFDDRREIVFKIPGPSLFNGEDGGSVPLDYDPGYGSHTVIRCERTPRALAEELMGGHLIYKNKADLLGKTHDMAPVLQTIGQLMGSMISFPFLCMINAAVLRLAFENYYGRRFTLDELPALINGDDIVFRGPSGLIKEWERCIALVGWTESPGKSYTSEDWFQINSRTFPIRFNEQSKNAMPYEVLPPVGFVNMGIVHGFQKGTKQQDVGEHSTSKCKFDEKYTVGNVSEKVRSRACQVYRDQLVERIDEAENRASLAWKPVFENPVELGGLGKDTSPLSWDLENVSRFLQMKGAVKRTILGDMDAVKLPVEERVEAGRLDLESAIAVYVNSQMSRKTLGGDCGLCSDYNDGYEQGEAPSQANLDDLYNPRSDCYPSYSDYED